MPILLTFCTLLIATASARSEESTSHQEFLATYCLDCHSGEAAEAGFRLDTLSAELAEGEVFESWVQVHDRVAAGEMPPTDYAELSVAERQPFLTELSHRLHRFQTEVNAKRGRVAGRRLTNLQLERTLHDLLGIDIPLKVLFSEEQKSDGFTTVARGQAMSHFQLEKHLEVVDLALDEAFRRALAKESDEQSKLMPAEKLVRTNPKRRCREPEMIDDRAVVWSGGVIFYGRVPATTARESGWYRFEIEAQSLKQPEDRGVWCTVKSGRCVSSAPRLTWIGAFEARPELQTWTMETWLPEGEMLEIRPGDTTLKRARFAGGQIGTGEGGPQDVPGVAINSIKMERIHLGPENDQIREWLLGELEIERDKKGRATGVASEDEPKQVEKLITQFATRAFRRPVEKSEVTPYISLVKERRASGESLLASLRAGYRALLCSPRFLYFHEEPGSLDQYAIASRLSYFLWNSMPDSELFALAADGKLQDLETLASQVDRMLDERHERQFVTDLADEWLDLNLIGFTQPDRRMFPTFDMIVQESMVLETREFLRKMLDEDLSVKLLIDADFSLLNSHLARYYGIEGVESDQLVPVTLSEKDHRGGLITHGAVMKVTANGTNTSPVVRGVWISERILGQEIPPVPEDVPAIEPDIRGATTIREMLEKHKSDDSCASCHVKIDPPGFALENFDPAGQWRDNYPRIEKRKRVKGPEIDTSSELPDGRSFDDLKEFQQLILDRPEKLAGNVVNKLVTYGTGAPVSFADRKEISEIVHETESQNYGFRSLIKAVVTSPLFLNK